MKESCIVPHELDGCIQLVCDPGRQLPYGLRLVREHYREVYSMLHRFVKNEEDAADLTQETFRKVWEKVDSYRGESTFSTWLFRIAHNNAMLFASTHWNPDKKLSLAIALLLCATARSDDFIQNGSFEKRNGEEPAGWFKAAVPADGLKMWLAKGAEEGSHYAAIQNTHRYEKPVANNWAQRIENIPKMKIVRLIARMQTVDAESVVVCIQCWNEKENKLLRMRSVNSE